MAQGRLGRPLEGLHLPAILGLLSRAALDRLQAAQSEWLRGRDTTRGLAEPLPAPHPALDRGLPEEGRSICPALDLDASCSPAVR